MRVGNEGGKLIQKRQGKEKAGWDRKERQDKTGQGRTRWSRVGQGRARHDRERQSKKGREGQGWAETEREGKRREGMGGKKVGVCISKGHQNLLWVTDIGGDTLIGLSGWR